jgi:hypothetical protein
MKYIKLLKESEESESLSQIEQLKSLPYKDFMKKLGEISKSEDFISNIMNMSDEVSKEVIESGYGQIKSARLSSDKLVPTQSQIGLKETLSWLRNVNSIKEIIEDEEAILFNSNRLLVANEKWILDGHHRWAYVYMLNPKAKIPCININLPGRSPEDILKDIQISLAATYNDVYVKQTPIEYNVSRMNDEELTKTIKSLIPDEVMEKLRLSYGNTDFMKWILRQFVVPKGLYESTNVQNDFISDDTSVSQLPNHPMMDELDATDNDNPDKDQLPDGEGEEPGTLSLADSYVGWTPGLGDIIAILMGIDLIYKGEVFFGIVYILSALPWMDVLCRPLIALLKSKVYKLITKRLSVYMKKFDVKKFAEEFLKLEKEDPEVAKFLVTIVEKIDVIRTWLSNVLRIIGDHWLKFRILCNIFNLDGFIDYIKSVIDYKKNIGEYLSKVSEKEVHSILSSNIIRIKGVIVDKKVDKLNINFSIGPHPIQLAQKAKRNPFEGNFKGVPTEFLNNIPKFLPGLKTVTAPKPKEDEQRDKKVVDFKSFTKGTDNLELPKEVQPKMEPKVEAPKPEVINTVAPIAPPPVSTISDTLPKGKL